MKTKDQRPRTKDRGEATTVVILVVALLGLGGWGLSKTKWFHRESKRAATSTETTAALVATTDERAAKAAAVLTKIGETNAEAPASPQQRVIARFVPIGLSLTGEPDPAFLLDLERLKVAELTGRLAQANALNTEILGDTARLRQDYARALAAKRASDLALEQAAAAARAAEQQAFWFMLLAGVAVVLYLWTKLSHVSPLSLSAFARDIRTGAREPDAIAALDANTTPFQQMNVALHHWFRTKLDAVTGQPSSVHRPPPSVPGP
jgi:hypothetical protein